MDYREFSKIETAEKLAEYFEGRAYKHTKYFHYTRLSVLVDILKNSELHASSILGFNDMVDKDSFGDDGKYMFAICFSCGTTENLSLWYMYSGMDGKGGRLNFSNSLIKKLIAQSTLQLRRKEEISHDVWKTDEDFLIDLQRDRDVKVKAEDVIYHRKEDKHYFLKYNTMTNNKISVEEFEKFHHTGFKKKLAWYYEKEMRILLELIGEKKKIIEASGKYRYFISVHFDESINKDIGITLAPMIEKIEDIDPDKERDFMIKRCFESSLSEYKGEVKMRFCERCDKKCKGESCDKKGGEKK